MTFSEYLQKIPDHVSAALNTKNLNVSDVLAYEYSDMSLSGQYCDCWMFLFDKFIYIMTGYDRVGKTHGNRKLDAFFEITDFRSFPTDDISRLSVERFLGTARLISVDKDDQVTELLVFSLGIANKMENFCAHFSDYKENKPFSSKHGDDETVFCPKCGLRYPDPQRPVCPKCMDTKSVLSRLMGFFMQYLNKLILFFVTIVIGSLFSVVSPYVGTKLLYDNVLTPGVDDSLFGQIGIVLLIIIAARLLSLVIGMAQSYVVAGIVPWVVYDLKIKIFSAMQNLSVSFFTSKQTGNLMQRVNRDSNNIYWFFVDGVPFMIKNIAIFIGILVIMLRMNWQLSLVVIVMMPLFLFLYRLIRKKFRRMHHLRWITEANMSSFISDSMSGQRVIKAFAKEKDEDERFAGYSWKSASAEISLSNMFSTVFPFLTLIMVLANLIVLAIGGIMIVNGEYDMTLGKLMLFTSYMNMLYGPLDFLAGVSNWWARCADSAQRIFEVMDAHSDVQEAEHPVRLPEMQGNIEMKNVKFEYEAGRPIIKNLSLSVKAGHMVGIVGKTGAGKSTIVNLMARLYDVNEGEITIDGVNVRDISSEDMRKNIGIVSQEIYLFMGSIADNIRYARPESSMEDVIAAAKAASAHEFIMRLPDGYETRIGAGGQDLSGGEKQRISIARTIIQNPKILILDEATASMDTETERHIQESLTSLCQGRTTVSIAHRLSTLRDADVLAVIDNGDMIEYGTHDELIKKKGEYYKLYMLQFDAIKHIGIAE